MFVGPNVRRHSWRRCRRAVAVDDDPDDAADQFCDRHQKSRQWILQFCAPKTSGQPCGHQDSEWNIEVVSKREEVWFGLIIDGPLGRLCACPRAVKLERLARFN